MEARRIAVERLAAYLLVHEYDDVPDVDRAQWSMDYAMRALPEQHPDDVADAKAFAIVLLDMLGLVAIDPALVEDLEAARDAGHTKTAWELVDTVLEQLRGKP